MIMNGRRGYRVTLTTFAVLIILFSGVIVFLLFFDERIPSEDLVPWLLFLAVSLITVIVFQSFRISHSAGEMAQHLARSEVMYSTELFTQLYNKSPIPYILLNSSGSITSGNFAAARLFGMRVNDLIGINVFERIDGEEKNIDRIATYPEKMREGIFVNDEEVRVARFDGAYRWVLLSLFPHFDPEGERESLLTLVDITKQKEIDKAKSEFVSLASHQLRTPIASMKWNMELMQAPQSGELEGNQKVHLEKISSAVSRMEMLIEDFLSVSKFELGTLAPELSRVQVNEIVREMIREQEHEISRKKIRVEELFHRTPIEIVSDTHLLRMAVGNLISNAVKYTPEGGTISVATESVGGILQIDITDTGIGIPEEDKEKIFSKIYRASNARSEEANGTGLGLYIVRESLRVIGGEVRFISKEGEGSTFTITLPQ